MRLRSVMGPSFAGASTVTPISPTVCVTPGSCVTVPFSLSRTDVVAMLEYHVKFHITGPVALCNGLSSITEGSYMNSSHTTSFQTIDDGGGVYEADIATLLTPCGATGASGNLFNISLKETGNDSPRLTVARDGQTLHSWPVSTGKTGHATPSGKFTTFRMEAVHFSKEWDDAPMPHSIFSSGCRPSRTCRSMLWAFWSRDR